MRRPFNYDYRSLVAPLGQRTFWSLTVPAAGWLQRIFIQQVGGASAGFTARVLRSVKPTLHDSSSGGDDPATAEMDPDAYIVGGVLTGVGGKLDQTFDDPVQYRNAESTPAVPVHQLYIEIDPAGSGPATWDVSLGGYTDVIG